MNNQVESKVFCAFDGSKSINASANMVPSLKLGAVTLYKIEECKALLVLDFSLVGKHLSNENGVTFSGFDDPLMEVIVTGTPQWPEVKMVVSEQSRDGLKTQTYYLRTRVMDEKIHDMLQTLD